MSFMSNLSGWLFESGLHEIERAYRASRKDFEADLADAAGRYDALKLADDAEGYTEDPVSGERLYYADHLIDMSYQAEEALRLIREAFTLVLHHYWEKQVKQWMSESYDIKKAYPWLKMKSVPIDELLLERLRHTANTIKHGAEGLYKLDQTMFDAGEIARGGGDPDYHEALRVEDHHVEQFILGLRKSAPTHASSI